MREIRTFVAVEVPPELKARIAQLQLTFQPFHERISWTKSHSIHLTLKFLGNVATERITAIETALQEQAAVMSPFSFQVEGTGVFPNSRQARVLWVGVNDDTGNLQMLAKNIDDALIHFGFSRENRKFAPHLTLGRIRNRVGEPFVKAFMETGFESFRVEVEKFVLMRSDLKPTGAVYTPLKEFRL